MAGRIQTTLDGLGSNKLLVPFFTAGFPTEKTTLELVRAAIHAGADMVEFGIPFSDPLADGPAIQYSSKVALDGGMSLKKILGLVESIRSFSNIPVILMGYFNPILAFGTDRFPQAAALSGVDGLIIPDLPVEEANEFRKSSEKQGLSMISLVSPTSSEKRRRLIDYNSTDLVYAVTVTGVTGARKGFTGATDNYLKELRQSLSKRFVAGFGVSSPEIARRFVRYADGVVIGSALVDKIRTAKNRTDSVSKVERFLKSIRKAI